jgi:hypothetical protein
MGKGKTRFYFPTEQGKEIIKRRIDDFTSVHQHMLNLIKPSSI